MSRVASLPKTRYVSKPCRVCGSTIRLKSNRSCVQCHRRKRYERYQEIRRQVIELYGNKCSCCPETIWRFLTIDHIKNVGGVKNRRHVYITYRDILREGYRPDKYRVMCFNCNSGREANGGICPHEELRRGNLRE